MRALILLLTLSTCALALAALRASGVVGPAEGEPRPPVEAVAPSEGSERAGEASAQGLRKGTLPASGLAGSPARRSPVSEASGGSNAQGSEASGASASPSTPSATGHTGGVEVERRVAYYGVSGRTAGDVLRGLQAGGPRVHGRAFFGLTETAYAFTYDHRESGGTCRVENVRVRLGVTLTLPRWAAPPEASGALRQDWARFDRALTAHEEGHEGLAREHAARLQRVLGGVVAPTCAAADAEVGRLTAALTEQAEAAHARYDAETDHGRTQGAVWEG